MSEELPTTLTVPNRDLLIMQFTGIKDRNGTPIFDGYVVEYEMQNSAAEVKKRVVIKWDERRVEPSGPDKQIGFYIPAAQERMEVIGNIHENPELLKSER